MNKFLLISALVIGLASCKEYAIYETPSTTNILVRDWKKSYLLITENTKPVLGLEAYAEYEGFILTFHDDGGYEVQHGGGELGAFPLVSGTWEFIVSEDIVGLKDVLLDKGTTAEARMVFTKMEADNLTFTITRDGEELSGGKVSVIPKRVFSFVLDQR